jgi:cob(I)alamin adenosyltransferase
MVTLNRIYTRTGDAGTTRLATGQSVSKADARVEAYGAVDETNACIGLARAHTTGDFDELLARLQNELFDLGADLATPAAPDETAGAKLRILDSQVDRLEREIDALHLARTVCRRAEREAVRLIEAGEPVSPPAMRYLNRLSDLLFVAARHANDGGAAEVFWQSGATR